MELWQGDIPKSLHQLDKELYESWTGGDVHTTIKILNQGQQIVDDYQRWTVSGRAAIDDLDNLPELLKIVIDDDNVNIEPVQPDIILTTGVIDLYRFTITNQTDKSTTVTIDSPELFRAGRQISIPPQDSTSVGWMLRTLEVMPFFANLNLAINGEKSTHRIHVEPEVDPRKPLLGTGSPKPGFGRYNRIRLGGKGKPPLDDLKKHPERYRPIGFEAVSSKLQDEVRMYYLSLQSQPYKINRIQGDWDYLELDKDKYSWDFIDANIQDALQLAKTFPVLQISYQPWWVETTRNPNGSIGFRDPRNKGLLEKYRQYVCHIAEHTKGKVWMFELWNEPIIYWFYPEPIPVPSGPQYVSEYGEMLKTVINISAEVLRRERSDSWIISPGFVDLDAVASAWSMLEYLLDEGTLDRVDALCVHKYPLGLDAKPPMGKSFRSWIEMDYWIDESPLLQLLKEKGKQDMPLWSTEAGGFGGERLDGLANLHVGSIMAHQGFAGLHFTSTPVSLNLLAEAVTGATPVDWGPCTKINSDYSGIVVKTFTRGPEDIIILWNNSDKTRSVSFAPPDRTNPPDLLMVQEFSEPIGGPARRNMMFTPDDLDGFFQKSFQIESMEWKCFLVVSKHQSGFRWLASIDGVRPDPTFKDIERLWKQAMNFRRDIFSGTTGSQHHQKAFKTAIRDFRESWQKGQLSAAEKALGDMVKIQQQAGK